MTYLDRLAAAAERAAEVLRVRGVDPRYLTFGGSEPAGRRQFVPTDARSEFLANRAMGDWAETLVADGLTRAFPALRVIRYGDSDRIAAGEPGFRQFYLDRSEDVRIHGKRPDLLLAPVGVLLDPDVAARPTAELVARARRAVLAIEVRSSKFEALTYMRVRQSRRAAGQKGGRETPSFTVKVEDLRIVYRWIEHHGVQQIYCQVFFDSVFAIDVLRVFGIIGGGMGFTIEQPKKNQEKATIMIPITAGTRIGDLTCPPAFEVGHRITELGRHDVYVRPTGGQAAIDWLALRSAIAEPGMLPAP